MAVPVLLLALGLGGCASEGDSAAPATPSSAAPAPGPAPSSGASQDPAVWAAYYDCLGAQGLKLQDVGGQKRVDKDANTGEAVTSAERTCAAKLPTRPTAAPDRVEAARKHAVCVRAKGVGDYPDPDPTTGDTPLEGPIADKVKSDPQVIAALKACDPTAGQAESGTVVGG
ncbi:hypothetical protein BU197_01650 [Streptomyces sp. CBMA291]|nr:hypothetical protein [Streptomyces sp. CBMA291]MBD0713656.1 hypothetical protein [Streptomyces sp. CBMA370]